MVRRNIVGKRVQQIRKSSLPPLTQLDLAARLQIQGVSIERPAISKIETGYRIVTDIEVAALAKALDVDVSSLFEIDH